MSKQIETIVEDIYGLFGSEKKFSEEFNKAFGERVAQTIKDRVTANNDKKTPTLRMSSLGQPCSRKLWYNINRFEEREELPVFARMKFLYGDLIEDMLLYLAKEAGHKVEGEQDELQINGVLGHRDAVIDGVLVDVKSASSYSFAQFAKGLTPDEDKFGYIKQLQQYLFASQDDPLVEDKNRAAFLVLDKTLGKLCLDVHKKDNTDYSSFVEYIKEVVEADTPPERAFKDAPDGKSGNRKLGVNCSYCDFKSVCWPSLRTFLYYNGPRFLTRVEKEPDVPEKLGG